MQTSQLELQPLLSEECPPSCPEGQVGWMPLAWADGHRWPTTGLSGLQDSSLDQWNVPPSKRRFPVHTPVPTAVHTLAPTATPHPGWGTMPCFPSWSLALPRAAFFWEWEMAAVTLYVTLHIHGFKTLILGFPSENICPDSQRNLEKKSLKWQNKNNYL